MSIMSVSCILWRSSPSSKSRCGVPFGPEPETVASAECSSKTVDSDTCASERPAGAAPTALVANKVLYLVQGNGAKL